MKRLFLIEVIGEEIRRISIHRATEQLMQGKPGSVMKAVDREFGIEEENCHVASGALGKTWLSFEIAWSFITHVNILVPNTAGRKLFLFQTSQSINLLNFFGSRPHLC